jgi:hypothetical protein
MGHPAFEQQIPLLRYGMTSNMRYGMTSNMRCGMTSNMRYGMTSNMRCGMTNNRGGIPGAKKKGWGLLLPSPLIFLLRL